MSIVCIKLTLLPPSCQNIKIYNNNAADFKLSGLLAYKKIMNEAYCFT